MPPFHWSDIPQKNSPLPLPFTLHLKTPTRAGLILEFYTALWRYLDPDEFASINPKPVDSRLI